LTNILCVVISLLGSRPIKRQRHEIDNMNQFFLANQTISCMTQVPDDELTQYPDEKNSTTAVLTYWRMHAAPIGDTCKKNPSDSSYQYCKWRGLLNWRCDVDRQMLQRCYCSWSIITQC